VMAVPESIVTFNAKGDSAWVQVREADGSWKKTPIRTGLSDGINIEVLDGLASTSELRGVKKVEVRKEAVVEVD
jgi:HlyD family secretion protein